MMWQPIETAPKDGRILLAVPLGGGQFRVMAGGWDNHWTGQTWVLDHLRSKGEDPTHWMPLPAPPA